MKLWHPFTQEMMAPVPIHIERAKGVYLYDHQHKSYIDLISSWWVNLHGHANCKIAKAIYNQAKTLEHVIFAGFTHEPAVSLCEEIAKLLPKTLSHFFFSDNGSTSVEVAIKMAYQYWYNQGVSNKTLFLCFEGGYHGDTFGAMSVGKKSGYHDIFMNFLFSVLIIPYPETWNDDDNVDIKEKNALTILQHYLEDKHDCIAAMILEPLVQGASGMKMCRISFIRDVITLVRSYNIFIIFDEVMTGFGRTGTMFSVNQIINANNQITDDNKNIDNQSFQSFMIDHYLYGKKHIYNDQNYKIFHAGTNSNNEFDFVPDFLCLSKGLTGGFMPLGLTITTENIYKAFLDKNFNKAFAHGHSYTANPLGCAAALASLQILCTNQTIKSIINIYNWHIDCLRSFKEINQKLKNKRRSEYFIQIEKIRITGTIAAFDLIVRYHNDSKDNNSYYTRNHANDPNFNDKPYLDSNNNEISVILKNTNNHVQSDIISTNKLAEFIRTFKLQAIENGLLIRPLNNTIYLMPPYVISKKEIYEAYNKIQNLILTLTL